MYSLLTYFWPSKNKAILFNVPSTLVIFIAFILFDISTMLNWILYNSHMIIYTAREQWRGLHVYGHVQRQCIINTMRVTVLGKNMYKAHQCRLWYRYKAENHNFYWWLLLDKVVIVKMWVNSNMYDYIQYALSSLLYHHSLLKKQISHQY